MQYSVADGRCGLSLREESVFRVARWLWACMERYDVQPDGVSRCFTGEERSLALQCIM